MVLSAKAAMTMQICPQNMQPRPITISPMNANPEALALAAPMTPRMTATPMIHSSIGNACSLLANESPLDFAALADLPVFPAATGFFFFFGFGISMSTGSAIIGSMSGIGGATRSISGIGGGGGWVLSSN